MNPHPDSISYVLVEGTAGLPAQGLLLRALPHLPPAHLGAGERVEAAGLGRPQHTVELHTHTHTRGNQTT